MKFYHRTTREAADAILVHGFQDAEGPYMTANIHRGVWISDMPLDVNEGAKGEVLLAVAAGGFCNTDFRHACS